MKFSLFTSVGNAERETLTVMLSGRSSQKLVKDEVSFAPPIDQWRAIYKSASQMHERRLTDLPAAEPEKQPA
jgi:hypothetical protein